jgi:hypothetical protein
VPFAPYHDALNEGLSAEGEGLLPGLIHGSREKSALLISLFQGFLATIREMCASTCFALLGLRSYRDSLRCAPGCC